ncbi:hypothetical protein [Streptomyces sp. NPDC087859]|uniref:hypothetical protein n=1 Tax=Streptomyces sp. NPDC087859 TaxID=3365812 RepID=UPI0037F4058C
MAPASATSAMIAASLVDAEVPLEWRRHLLGVLSNLIYGEQEDIAISCKEAVRGCIEIFFEEISSGRSKMAASYAFELLMAYEDQRDRLRVYQVEARSNLPDYLHQENLDLDSL